MSGNQQLQRAAIFVGYLVWFLILVRVLFLSTGNPSTSTGDVLGSHAGLTFWLLVISLIPYFMARARAKKDGTNMSWSYVMVGTTLIALMLSVGGFYGRTQTAAAVTPPSADPAGTQYVKDANGETHRLVPYSGDYEPLQAGIPQPTLESKGWTEESTGIDIIDPFKEAPPAGTRYYRNAQGIIYRVYPPGVRPDLPSANPFGLGDSTVGAPPRQ